MGHGLKNDIIFTAAEVHFHNINIITKRDSQFFSTFPTGHRCGAGPVDNLAVPQFQSPE